MLDSRFIYKLKIAIANNKHVNRIQGKWHDFLASRIKCDRKVARKPVLLLNLEPTYQKL
jgi:hypothetical protein